MSEKTKRRLISEFFAVLLEMYPTTFYGKDSPDTKPIKVGMVRDLRDRHPDISPSIVSLVLWKYTEKDRYLHALATNPLRFGLDGNPDGHVTAQQRQYAISKIKFRKSRKNKKQPTAAPVAP